MSNVSFPFFSRSSKITNDGNVARCCEMWYTKTTTSYPFFQSGTLLAIYLFFIVSLARSLYFLSFSTWMSSKPTHMCVCIASIVIIILIWSVKLLSVEIIVRKTSLLLLLRWWWCMYVWCMLCLHRWPFHVRIWSREESVVVIFPLARTHEN